MDYILRWLSTLQRRKLASFFFFSEKMDGDGAKRKA
jgi:hypothetical protein